MKKIILVLIIFIACYFIYNLTIDKKVSYLTLGDILSKGTNEYGVSNNGYSNYIRDYLKDKGMLKEYNNTFTSNDYRILDIIRILSYNEKKDNYSLNRLIKESDIITVSLGMSEIYSKILEDYNKEYENREVNEPTYKKRINKIFRKRSIKDKIQCLDEILILAKNNKQDELIFEEI